MSEMKTDRLDLRNMDCMDLMAEFPDNHFNLAVVDPPYGRNEDGGTKRNKKVKQKNGVVIEVFDGGYKNKNWDKEPPSVEYFNELFRVSKDQIIFGINYMPILPPSPGRIIWDKVNDGAHQCGAEIAYCSTSDRVELVRYMWRGMMQGLSIERGTIQQGNKSLNERRIHPTQKPVKLYEWILGKYAKEGFKLLDTHMGSGSIAIASHYANMHLTSCELDEDYFKAACERIERETRQLNFL